MAVRDGDAHLSAEPPLAAPRRSGAVPVLRGGAVGDIDEVLRACVAGKRRSHGIDEPGFVQPQRGMNAIGG